MQVEQFRILNPDDLKAAAPSILGNSAQLVLLFGSTTGIRQPEYLSAVKSRYPKALFFGCSTAGEIFDTQVSDDSLVATAVFFEHTSIRHAHVTIGGPEESYSAGISLARSLDGEGLAHVFVLSDGLKINGSDLVRGLTESLPPKVTITGGLSGDGARFEETLVLLNGEPRRNAVTALGFYGDRIRIGFGSLGGWDPFGPERLVTRSKGNILFELEGKSALELYKTYLGEHAAGLPATGLLFPLSVRSNNEERGVVRTILGVDEENQSMTFAGDVPEGTYARLMKANFDRLIDGAVGAAKTSLRSFSAGNPSLAILISCVGRKMVLGQRVEEEVEGVRDVFGEKTVIAGFYSYGEISPFNPDAKCELHNQTMTITLLAEN